MGPCASAFIIILSTVLEAARVESFGLPVESIFKGEGPPIVIREDDLRAHHSVAKGVGGAFEISQVTRTQSAFEILQVTRTPPTPFTCVSRQHEPMCLDPCAIEDDARGRGGERSISYKLYSLRVLERTLHTSNTKETTLSQF